MVYECLHGGDAETLYSKRSHPSDTWHPEQSLAISWCKQLFSALDFLHTSQPPIAHCDVKPANLLLSEDRKTMKLADFSLVSFIGEEPKDCGGSYRYIAPEVTEGRPYALDKADIFSGTEQCLAERNAYRDGY